MEKKVERKLGRVAEGEGEGLWKELTTEGLWEGLQKDGWQRNGW